MKYFFGCLITLPFFFSNVAAQGQIQNISFELSHSLRIPNHKVIIELKRDSSEVILHLRSKPMSNDEKWKSSIIDTTFRITDNVFKKLLTAINKISKKDIQDDKVLGLDGTTCTIKIGNNQNLETYFVWSPNYETGKRRLVAFLRACKLIIKVAGLEPKSIL